MTRSSRRRFAKSIVVAAAALPVVTADALAQAAPPPLATALTGVVRAQHGRHLTDEQMVRVAKDFQDYIPYLERFREFKLANSDEPDFTFASLARR